MKPCALLLPFVLATGWAPAQTVIEFSRHGNEVQVDQNGQKTVVPADSADNSDFLVPVPGPDTTSTPASPLPETAPAPVAPPVVVAAIPTKSKPHKVKKVVVATPVTEPASIHYASPATGTGTILDPSILPSSDDAAALPSVHLAHGDVGGSDIAKHLPSISPAPAPALAPRDPNAVALDVAERKELNMYRALLAKPLEITIGDSQVDVQWNAAHGAVAIPASKKIDIKLDRVAQSASR